MYGNYYFCCYVTFSLDRPSQAAAAENDRLRAAASALNRGLQAVDRAFALEALSHSSSLSTQPPALLRATGSSMLYGAWSQRDARRAVAARTLDDGITLGYKYMNSTQLKAAGIDLEVEINTAAVELPAFASDGKVMRVSECFTSRPAWLRQVMCLPRAGGGATLWVPSCCAL